MRVPALPLEGDTIVAISTPFGVGGIGIVRVSGPAAEKIALKIFRPKRPCDRLISRYFYYGHIYNPQDGMLIDEVLLVIMRPPYTYTREEIVEIHCHGGAVPVRRILELAIHHGARLAEAGEFTRRAFLSGRIDLVQAEAVIDVVEAKSETALRFAQRQLDGSLSLEIQVIQKTVKDMLIRVEAWLDFPEEDMPDPDISWFGRQLEEKVSAVSALIKTYNNGHLFRDGVNLVIGGRANVGKSTLLNVLVGKERAIVSPVPGTTRDYLEESLLLEGIPIRLIDTAGLRDNVEEIEAKGVAFARRKIDSADLVLYVVDASRFEEESDGKIQDIIANGCTLMVLNKIDLVEKNDVEALMSLFPSAMACVAVSALYGQGLEQLRQEVLNCLTEEKLDLDSRAVITNLRHRRALENSLAAMARAKEQLDSSPLLGDLLAADLRSALGALGEIIGETTPEEILNSIFESFCIGK